MQVYIALAIWTLLSVGVMLLGKLIDSKLLFGTGIIMLLMSAYVDLG